MKTFDVGKPSTPCGNHDMSVIQDAEEDKNSGDTLSRRGFCFLVIDGVE
jgi:hypothetical protein